MEQATTSVRIIFDSIDQPRRCQDSGTLEIPFSDGPEPAFAQKPTRKPKSPPYFISIRLISIYRHSENGCNGDNRYSTSIQPKTTAKTACDEDNLIAILTPNPPLCLNGNPGRQSSWQNAGQQKRPRKKLQSQKQPKVLAPQLMENQPRRSWLPATASKLRSTSSKRSRWMRCRFDWPLKLGT